MERRNVSSDILIEPTYFHNNRLYDHILSMLKEQEMTCTKEHGYIDHIYQITNIINYPLLDNGHCRIHVEYDASCFRPEIGKVISTKVEMTFPHGIFTSLYLLRFLIPYKSLEDEYVYIQEEGYQHIQDKNIWIRVGSMITIEITNMKYDGGHYSCIAKLN